MTDTAELTRIITAHVGHCPKGRKSRIRFLALALAGEAGELANNVKKEWRGDDLHTLDPALAAKRRAEKIVAELVDVANYAWMLAKVMGVDLPPAMLAKFADVDKRPEFHNYGTTLRTATRSEFERRRVIPQFRGS